MAVAEMHQTTWLLRFKFGHGGPGGQEIAKSDEFLANDGNNIIKFTKSLMHVDAFNKHSSYCDLNKQLSVKCQERKCGACRSQVTVPRWFRKAKKYPL